MLRFLAFLLSVLLVGGWAGCGCHPDAPKSEASAKPSLRLILFSNISGALQPCGCVKDMLGGVEHAAAYLRAQTGMPTLALGAGPMLFMDPALSPERRVQDTWKAEAMARALREMNVRAWSPGANDFAAGADELLRMVQGGPIPVAANLNVGESGAIKKSLVLGVGGYQVGVTGASLPKYLGKLPDGVQAADPLPSLRAEAAKLKQQGTSLRILLLSMSRGEALRLAELVPEFQLVVVGKPADPGENNDPPVPATSVGQSLVIEAPNHLQSFYVVDLFVKDGRFAFENADATSEDRAELERRIADLERHLSQAEQSGRAKPEDLKARRADLSGLKAQLAALGKRTTTPTGSYYRAERIDVRERLGHDPALTADLREYYRRVNEHNRVAFQDKKPVPAPPDAAYYIGVEQCALCHSEEHSFWKKTRHSNAYLTLARDFKEFNLDCVGCHVTGYQQPGGSTVTHVEKLKDVQCEVCHGPGSRHFANPGDHGLIVRRPEKSLCANQCHHAPHVNPDWSVELALPQIVGPGHGG